QQLGVAREQLDVATGIARFDRAHAILRTAQLGRCLLDRPAPRFTLPGEASAQRLRADDRLRIDSSLLGSRAELWPELALDLSHSHGDLGIARERRAPAHRRTSAVY